MSTRTERRHFISCDYAGCDEEHEVVNKAKAFAEVMHLGWTTRLNKKQYHYCLEHTVAYSCEVCERPMVPSKRKRSDFPKNWVTYYSSELCVSCQGAIRSGRLHNSYRLLDGAVELYLAARGEKFRAISALDQETQREWAKAIMPEDIAHYLDGEVCRIP